MDNQILYISFNCGEVAGLLMLTESSSSLPLIKKKNQTNTIQTTKNQKMPKTTDSSLSYFDY